MERRQWKRQGRKIEGKKVENTGLIQGKEERWKIELRRERNKIVKNTMEKRKRNIYAKKKYIKI